MDPLLPENDEKVSDTFKALTPEETERVKKIYNLISGGITDPQLQALLIYRHLLHTGWLPPQEAGRLAELKDDALSDLQLLREELKTQDDKDSLF